MKTVIKTDAAPAAVGPYSQAIATTGRRLLFCSGQIALDPAGGVIVGKSAPEQARQALTNLRAVLEAAGGSLDNVVRTTIYLVDIGQFGAVNEVYAEFFRAEPPARAAVAVAALPKGGAVMIDAVAALD